MALGREEKAGASIHLQAGAGLECSGGGNKKSVPVFTGTLVIWRLCKTQALLAADLCYWV